MKKRLLMMSATLILSMLLSSIALAVEYAKVDLSKFEYEATVAEAANTPISVVDESTTNRWGKVQPGENVTVVLEKAYSISTIEMRFYRASERFHYMKFEYSTDAGKTWTEVKSTKVHSVADPALGSAIEGYYDEFPLEKVVEAQYWKITYLGREDSSTGTGIAPNATECSIWEINFLVSDVPATTTDTTDTATAPTEPTTPAATQSTANNNTSNTTETQKIPATGSESMVGYGILILGAFSGLVLVKKMSKNTNAA